MQAKPYVNATLLEFRRVFFRSDVLDIRGLFGGVERLVTRRGRKGRECRVLPAQRVDRLTKRSETGDGVVTAIVTLGQHDVSALTAREIAGIDAELLPGRRRRRVEVIQAQIAGDDIGTAVVVEIAHRQRVPAAAHRSEADGRRHVAESVAFVPE